MVAGANRYVDPAVFVAWFDCQPDTDQPRGLRLLGSRRLPATVTETRRCPNP